MDKALKTLAARQGGVIVRSQALAAGFADSEIVRLRERGELTAIRRGAYIDRAAWAALDDVGQHRALVHAVVLQLNVPAVPSHVSAAVLLGLPLWDVDLSTVHVTRTDRHAPRLEAAVHHHTGPLPESDLTTADGITVTGPARTAVDLARTVSFESAVVTADSALAQLSATSEVLLGVLDRMRDWRGARAAGRVVGFADGRAESVGESRHRVQLQRIGLPSPQLQVVVSAPTAETDRVDFYFEDYATIGEFDGRDKYGRFARDGETAGDVVWREKQREDRLRGRGFEVVRSTWADLYRDDVVAARYRRAFARTNRAGSSRRLDKVRLRAGA